MNATRRLVTGSALLLVVVGCTDARDPLGPASAARPLHASSSAAQPVQASGSFAAIVDFSTLTLTPKGRNCQLEVDGKAVFTGTIVGTADAHTSALVFASCADVATTPPGTYADVFHSDLVFHGTVDGVSTTATGRYLGRSAPGGRITGRLVFASGMAGSLDVDAQLAVGGTYDGHVVVR